MERKRGRGRPKKPDGLRMRDWPLLKSGISKSDMQQVDYVCQMLQVERAVFVREAVMDAVKRVINHRVLRNL